MLSMHCVLEGLATTYIKPWTVMAPLRPAQVSKVSMHHTYMCVQLIILDDLSTSCRSCSIAYVRDSSPEEAGLIFLILDIQKVCPSNICMSVHSTCTQPPQPPDGVFNSINDRSLHCLSNLYVPVTCAAKCTVQTSRKQRLGQEMACDMMTGRHSSGIAVRAGLQSPSFCSLRFEHHPFQYAQKTSVSY